MSCSAEPLFDGGFTCLFWLSLENRYGLVVSSRASQIDARFIFCAPLAAFLINSLRFASFDLLLNQQVACCQPILRRHRQ